MKIFEIPGKLEVMWNKEANAVIDTWLSYDVSLQEFHEAVLVHGLQYAKASKATAWVVDSSQASGEFSKEIQSFIEKTVFPTFSQSGIIYFITISSKVSSLANMTILQYSEKLKLSGIRLLELNNVKDAITWLKRKH